MGYIATYLMILLGVGLFGSQNPEYGKDGCPAQIEIDGEHPAPAMGWEILEDIEPDPGSTHNKKWAADSHCKSYSEKTFQLGVLLREMEDHKPTALLIHPPNAP